MKIGLAWAASLILALPVILVGVLAYAVSAGVRALARMLEPRHVSWRDLMEFDPNLGWRPKPNLDAYYLVRKDDVHQIRTDSEGWPRVDPLGDEHAVVVIGDSYAFGFGIDTGSSFADLTTSPRVKAIGANGYSMVQGLILMRQLASRLQGKLVIWFVYLENDLYDNVFPSVFGYRTPFVRQKNGAEEWELVTDHVTPEKWVTSAIIRPNMDILAELCTPTPFSRRIYSACRYLIDEASKVCRDAGAELLVMGIPNLNQLEDKGQKMLASRASQSDGFDVRYPENRIGEICREYGVPFVPGSSFLEPGDYKIWERWHWNERGHAKVAEIIRSLHETHISGGAPKVRTGESDDEQSSQRVMVGTSL